MSFYIFLKKMKKLNLEILPNGKRYTFFLHVLNAIPTCKVISKYLVCSLGGFFNENQNLYAIPTCKLILK